MLLMLVADGNINRMKKLTENKNYILLCIFYITYYITLGVYTPYLNVYYERLGFNGSQIGLITSVGLIASMLITPIWGALSDRYRNPKAMIAFLLTMTAVSSWIWVNQTQFLPVLIFALVLSVFRNNVWSLIDGVGIQFCAEGNYDFAFARSMGSLGYLLGSFVIAGFLQSLGMTGPFISVLIVSSLISAVLILFLPHQHKNKENQKKVNFSESVGQLAKNRGYLFVLVIMLLTSMTVDCVLNYSGNHIVNTLQQNDSMIGVFSCAQVLPEVIIVMFANRIFRRMKTSQIFMFGAMAQFVRFVLCALFPNILIFLAATTLHGITIAVSSVGYVSFIHKKVDSRILSTAMALYGTVSTIGSALMNQLFGTVYQYSSSTTIFWIAAGCALLAMGVIMLNKGIDQN